MLGDVAAGEAAVGGVWDVSSVVMIEVLPFAVVTAVRTLMARIKPNIKWKSELVASEAKAWRWDSLIRAKQVLKQHTLPIPVRLAGDSAQVLLR